MKIIACEGAGLVVVIKSPSADAFTSALRVKTGETTFEEMEALRDYGVGASILTELGVREMILLTNTHPKLVGLAGNGCRW